MHLGWRLLAVAILGLATSSCRCACEGPAPAAAGAPWGLEAAEIPSDPTSVRGVLARCPHVAGGVSQVEKREGDRWMAVSYGEAWGVHGGIGTETVSIESGGPVSILRERASSPDGHAGEHGVAVEAVQLDPDASLV